MTKKTEDIATTIDRLVRFFFVARTYGKALHAMRSISMGQRSIMMELARLGDRTVVQMTMLRGLSKPAVQKTVDQLAERDLVKKTTPSNDRRSRIISLTSQGKLLMHEMHNAEIAEFNELSPLINDSDMVAINRFLDIVEFGMGTQCSEFLAQEK